MARVEQKFKNFDEYIATFPVQVQEVLQKLRGVVHSAAPGTTESITYHMPTFSLGEKYLLHFAAWKKHVALYGISTGTGELKEKLAKYVEPKGTIKFMFSETIPYNLIKQLIEEKIK